MTGVLGVPTIEYLPYAFFNIINPILAILFGFIGFRVEHQEPTEQPGQDAIADSAKQPASSA
jgi:NhaC family Na+:H+ antiporter